MEELAAWLTEHTVSWSLEVDPYRLVHADRRDYLTEHLHYEEFTTEQIAELMALPALYEARAYPSTPVGFVMVHAGTAAEALALLKAEVE